MVGRVISIDSSLTALEVLKKFQKFQQNAVKENIECQFICNTEEIYQQIKAILDDIERKQSKISTPYANDSSITTDNESESEYEEEEDQELVSSEGNEQDDDSINEQALLQSKIYDETAELQNDSNDESLIFKNPKVNEEFQSNKIEINVKSYYDALVLNSYFAINVDKRFKILKPNKEIQNVHKLYLEVKNKNPSEIQKIKEHIQSIYETLYQFLFYLPRNQYLQLRNSTKLQTELCQQFKVNFAFDINFRIKDFTQSDNRQFYFIIYGQNGSQFKEAFEYILQSKLVKIYTLSLTTDINSKEYQDQKYRKYLAFMRIDILNKKKYDPKIIYEINQIYIQTIRHKQGFTMNYDDQFSQYYKNIWEYFSKKVFWCISSSQEINDLPKINYFVKEKTDKNFVVLFLTNINHLAFLNEIIEQNKNHIIEVVIQKQDFELNNNNNFEKININLEKQDLQKKIKNIQLGFENMPFQKKYNKALSKIQNQMKERQMNFDAFKNGKGRYLENTNNQLKPLKKKNINILSDPSLNNIQKKNSQQLQQQNMQQQQEQVIFNLFQQQQQQQCVQNNDGGQRTPQQQKLTPQLPQSYQKQPEKCQQYPLNSQKDNYNNQIYKKNSQIDNNNNNNNDNKNNNNDTSDIQSQFINNEQSLLEINNREVQINQGFNAQIKNNFIQQQDFEEAEQKNQRRKYNKMPRKNSQEQLQREQREMILCNNMNQNASDQKFQAIQKFDQSYNQTNQQNYDTNQNNSGSQFQVNQFQNIATNQKFQFDNNLLQGQSNQPKKDNNLSNYFQTNEINKIQHQSSGENNEKMESKRQAEIKQFFQKNKQELQKQDLNKLDQEIQKYIQKLSPDAKVYQFNQQQNLPQYSQTKFYHSVFLSNEFQIKEIKESCAEQSIYIFKISEDQLIKKGDTYCLANNFNGYPILFIKDQ
ncbi:hypothetical protein TTHERM_00335790 (macronuclear) [Tetrahymena thermophila SB210]|uniref:Uncharacterized protein n=1 Tax=Tetrahymena thermophila (strain SB210) TaxID=312017 RepID=I7LV65_TETTS|nr:hypothetical protein TTHERM_00335790 [Tetrahymena thermophila SB210]EAR97302.2 hypothetical protein TTHERM_00335790 [Tetrahymena thermophila SB210]|eukprot:XP_001017547.2 hypothetical protein TTHERM_00335790 [Tetrahymena thermophila SB210]